MTDTLVKILLAVVLLGGIWFGLDTLGEYKARAEAAEGALAAYAKNDTLNGKLVDAFQERQAKLKPITNTIIREIEKPRPYVEPSCSPALDPVFDAIRGLRKIDGTR